MSKVTSTLQLTVRKAIADQYGIHPGDELEWIPAGDVIRVVPPGRIRKVEQVRSLEERMRWFDAATKRQQTRERALKVTGAPTSETKDRG
jgi:bifunctional DNA-binding transcriptional regulator/antitoxin component of YhaV-PrlF toxin-antitoxin module